jgi:hypothetical protein
VRAVLERESRGVGGTAATVVVGVGVWGRPVWGAGGLMKAWCKFFMFTTPLLSLPPLPLPLPSSHPTRGLPAAHAALALQHARTSTLLNSAPPPLPRKMAFSRFPALAAAVVLVATAGLASAEVREEWTGGGEGGPRRAAAPQWRRAAARACGGGGASAAPGQPRGPHTKRVRCAHRRPAVERESGDGSVRGGAGQEAPKPPAPF